MTSSTANSSGIGPFDGLFQTGAAIVSVLLFLVAVVFAWTGFQRMTLFVVGTEMNIVTGAVGFMLTMFFAIGALIVALFMDSGFDH
ncbi:hypothetical protein [Haloterrigena salifodinae]|uniref:Uncharacterized protein n=1 Tax=Haloterrigena salifodinae TaxID=2675099 RepID=A0A8T8E0V0_9EURY|nr:hypothetical protein [Haloterrigena salifodinae]QRV15153.1 hypothetical protein JMJ58_19955 [Haloterrigena salifodinae]